MAASASAAGYTNSPGHSAAAHSGASARTAVIFGAVGLYAGLVPALSIYLIALGLILAVGLALNKMMPGKPPDMVMEVFPFRMPQPRSLAFKTWHRFKHFLLVAMPIVIVGSLILGGLYETGVISYLSAPLAPVVGGWRSSSPS